MDIRIAISMGDPTGIGPEIILRALRAGALPSSARPVVYGSRAVFERLARRIDVPLAADAEWIDVGLPPADVGGAGLEAAAGRLQVEALRAAVDAVVAGEAAAVCTAPICKAAAASAGFAYPGHTEYLAERGGASAAKHAMMLAGLGEGGRPLRVVVLSGHLPLREVAASLEPRAVANRLVLTALALASDFGIVGPRVALTGLNPHAGEEGVLGDEERRVLEPALAIARERLGLTGDDARRLSGPWPADGLFAGDPAARFDAVVCCYHDQGLIPFKMRHIDDGVNVTLGLPFVRTSPAHGTAFDIAGQGIARPGSMIAALRMAAALAARRLAAA